MEHRPCVFVGVSGLGPEDVVMSAPTHLRALAVVAPLLMVAAALPLPAAAAAQPITVFFELPDQSLADVSVNPAGWTEGYDRGYPFGADQTGIMELTVRNDGTDTIQEVAFRVPRDLGQDTASDAPDDDSYIQFLQGTSTATGWTTSVIEGQVTFRYDSGGTATLLGPGQSWKFRIGFQVEGPLQTNGGDPYQFDMIVQAKYTSGELALPRAFKLTHDDAAPALVPEDNQVRPALTRDLDGNGLIDQVIVNYADLLDTSSFALEHFRINSQRPIQADFDWIAPGQEMYAGEAQLGACPGLDDAPWGCTQVRFTIEEGNAYDTGTLPFISHLPSGASLTDQAGNRLPQHGIAAADGAAPVLVGALARTTDSDGTTFEAVLLTFSEGIGAANALAATDFSYLDTSSSSASHQAQDPASPGSYLDYPAVQSVDHQSGSHHVLLVFRDPSGNGPAGALTANDAPAMAPELAKPASAAAKADLVGCRAVGGLVTIKDLSTNGPGNGGIPCRSTGARDVPVLSLTVVEAATDIGSQEVRLRFNGPVESFSGGDITAALGAFSVEGTQSGNVFAIVGVEHRVCTDTVVLTIENSVHATDVDQTPSQILIRNGKIRGCSAAAGPGTTDPPTIAPAPAPLRDKTAPRIIALRTVDLDHNGAIDGFEVTFSEPVRDLSFCDGANPCPVGGMVSLHVRDPTEANVYNLADYGPFTFETRNEQQILAGNTGVGRDDTMGIIRWPQNDPDRPNALLTGYVPDLDVAQGLFEDLAPVDFPGGANLLKRLTRAEVEETDGAPPVVVLAVTADTDTYRLNATGAQIPGCTFNPETADNAAACQTGPNGYLDGYFVFFTEPVRDSTYTPVEWNVEGYQLERTVPVRPSLRSFDSVNDDVLFMPFFEVKTGPGGEPTFGDTGALPNLTYQQLPGNAGGGGLRDLRGNAMNPVLVLGQLDLGPDDIEEFDGAAPVIVAAEGFIGQNWIRVQFSEGVDDGQDGALVSSDFGWQNIHLGGAGGITNSPQVEHQAADRQAKVYLNNKLTLGDIMHDLVSANFDQVHRIGAIYETQTKVLERQYVSGAPRALQNATDRTPPGNVTELNHTFLGPDRVVLVWRAPGEDGQDADNVGPDTPGVSHYSIRVSRDPIASFGGGTNVKTPPEGVITHSSVHALPEGISVKAYDPARLAAPGGIQKVEIVGLQPDTKYNFGVIAVDDAGLVSPEVAVVTRTTNVDNTAPTGALNPRVTNKVDGRVVTLDVQVQWDALNDDETATIDYRFLFSKDPNAIVTLDNSNGTAQTQATVHAYERGTWYFHVRGFTGKPGEQASLPVTITAPPVDADEAADYAFFFNTPGTDDHSVKVTRKGSGNVINWTLPEGPPGNIEAIQVWRLDGFDAVLVATIPGDWSTLRRAEFTDTNGTATSRYFVAPVYEGAQGMVDPGEMGLLDDQWTAVSKSSGLAWYWYLVIALSIALIAGAVVLFVVLRGRADAATETVDPDRSEGWSDVSEEGALPVHDVDCPQCNHPFQAVGHLPLPIECPECGVAGKLE